MLSWLKHFHGEAGSTKLIRNEELFPWGELFKFYGVLGEKEKQPEGCFPCGWCALQISKPAIKPNEK